jgi:hypothetical protein
VTELALAESTSVQEQDERMTAEREETKYLVPTDRLEPLLIAVSHQLTPHHFSGVGANRLPDPHHFVTTIYFDTPSRRHFRSSTADAKHNVKVRAKEYYDLHPSLAELATDPSQIVRYQPWLWFEIKRRSGSHTSKRRFRLPKREVPRVFRGDCLSTEALWLEAEREATVAGLTDIAEYVECLGEPLSASVLVNYRRLSWQNPDSTLRITLDLGLAFFAPPEDLWNREQALVRHLLGPQRGAEREAVLEIKRRGPIPGWLHEALDRIGVQPCSFSKFVAAARAVHGSG